MITRIKIQGYKSIQDQEIELKPINILLGGNGVGKSNFISIFTLIRNIYIQNLQSYVKSKGGADTFLHFGKKTTYEINFEITFGSILSDTNRYIVKLKEAQDSLFINSTKTAFLSYTTWSHQWIEKNKLESELIQTNKGQAYYLNKRLKEFDVYHFHDTGDKSPMKGNSNVNDNRYLKNDGSNIASFLYFLKLKHNKHFQRIEKTIQSVAPFFDKFVLEPSNLNVEMIRLEWREKGAPESYFNAYHLSDGTLRFICLATLLMQPEPPGTVIIDEPELGLHPVAINKLAALIRNVSKTTQVIISTQSLNLIDNFDPEDIVVTERTEQGSNFYRLNPPDLENWLKDYTLGDLWGKNIFGAQPYTIG
ncbi:AAA family ATPase [Aquiflexum sp.]|uniref:AAA family ATPase n=1 Tax=Aquiflexum sp. TaxID=1872584 RepID=UPI00359325F5